MRTRPCGRNGVRWHASTRLASRRGRVLFLTLLAMLLPLLPVHAAETGWNALQPELQTLLGEYRDSWDRMEPARRQSLLERGRHWLALPQERRTALWQRFQRWESMSPDKRMSMEQAWERFRQLPDAERQRMLEAHQKFHRMSPQQQRLMMQRFEEFQHRGGHMTPGHDMGEMGDMKGMMMPGGDRHMPEMMENMRERMMRR